MGSRWKFAAIQLLRKFHGSVHVFCRPDRSADYSRVVGFRHGKRPCACVTAGRPVAVATEYVGYSRCYGEQKKTIVYVALVIIMATISGFVFGNFF